MLKKFRWVIGLATVFGTMVGAGYGNVGLLIHHGDPSNPSLPPANLTRPVVTGVPQVGQVLTTSNGTWSNSPSSFTYQWQQAGVGNIAGATSSTYTLVAGDINSVPICLVTATSAAGSATAFNNVSRFGIYSDAVGGGPATMLYTNATKEGNHAHLQPVTPNYIAYGTYNTFVGGIATELNGYNGSEIRTIRVSDGLDESRVPSTVGKIAANPSWTPDGLKFLYVTNVGGNGNIGIGQYTLATNAISYYYNPADMQVADPHMRAAGDAIVITGIISIGGGNFQNNLFVYSGGTRTQLTNPSLTPGTSPFSGDYDPKWSPDGTKIATMRWDTKKWSVIVVSVGTSPTFANNGELNLTPAGPATDAAPEWSSDGALITFWHADPSSTAANGIYTMHPDGTNRTKISLPSDFFYTMPTFAPGVGSAGTSPILVSGQLQGAFDIIAANATLPAISGTAQVGQTLTASNGTWNHTATSFSYQWNRAGTPISGATAVTYVPVSADVGNTLTVSVVAINTGGWSSPAVSAPTSSVGAAGAVVAFPGAEGFGAVSVGGRGGKVVHVTNTNDSGAGSLRAALTQTVPRTVVFDTGGTINLNSAIVVDSTMSYLTIAGQTAPGGGIQITGWAVRFQSGFHDGVIRYFKSRSGHQVNGDDWSTDHAGIEIDGQGGGTGEPNIPTYNIIVDHCDMEYSSRDNFDVWDNVHNLTISRSIMADPITASNTIFGFRAANMGSTADSGLSSTLNSGNFSVHHNLFAHNPQRNPNIRTVGNAEVVNNVMYDYAAFATEADNWGGQSNAFDSGQSNHLNVIGNYYKIGPNTNGFSNRLEVTISHNPNTAPGTVPSLYVLDNISPHRTSATPTTAASNWTVVGDVGPSSCGYATCQPPTGLQATTPFAMSSTYPITTQDHSGSTLTVFNNVLADVGANKVNGDMATVANDTLTQRMIDETTNGNGASAPSTYPAGSFVVYPTLAAGSAPTDTDCDGIPDSVEIAAGLSPSHGSCSTGLGGDSLLTASNGYTNLENYLNGVPLGGGGGGGLVGHWTFDESSGTTAFDTSGSGNNGTFVGSPTRIAGHVGSGALSFNQGDYVNIPDATSLQMSGDFSIATWIKTTEGSSSTNAPSFMSKFVHTGPADTTNGFQMILHFQTPVSTPDWAMLAYQTGTIGKIGFGTIDVADGTWHHVVGVRKGSNILTYQDGALAATTTGAPTGPIPASGQPMLIGYTASSDGFFIGAMDDVRIYSCAVNAADVSAMYAGGGPTTCGP